MSNKNKIIDIENAANFFNNHFVNKRIVYRTENNSISVEFKPEHFSHLCGLKYKYGAKQFFKAVLGKKLNLKLVEEKKDGTTSLKLDILKSIKYLISDQIRLTQGAVYLELAFDNAIRTNKKIFAITFKVNDQDTYHYPNSLLNLKKDNTFPNGDSVLSIESINIETNKSFFYFKEKIKLTGLNPLQTSTL